MSEANKAVALNFLNALGGGDVATLKTVMAEDIEAIATGTSVFSGTRHFKELAEICAGLGQFTKSGISFKLLHATAEDDRVSLEMEGSCALKNGTAYNNSYHFLVFVRGGKVYKMKEYFDTKLADAVLAPAMAG